MDWYKNLWRQEGTLAVVTGGKVTSVFWTGWCSKACQSKEEKSSAVNQQIFKTLASTELRKGNIFMRGSFLPVFEVQWQPDFSSSCLSHRAISLLFLGSHVLPLLFCSPILLFLLFHFLLIFFFF